MNPESSVDESSIPELGQIIEQLQDDSGGLPKQAILDARRHSEKITPILIQLIEDATSEERQGRTPANDGHVLAVYLLADFQATEAWPTLMKAISLPGDGPYDLFGDAITEDFGYIMATLVGDRYQDVEDLLSNPNIDLYVRWIAAETLMYFVRDGAMTRESVIKQVESHLRRAIEDGNGDFAECLINTLEDLAAESSITLIEEAFRADLIDQNMTRLEPILANIARGDEQFREAMSRLKVIEDTVEHLEAWAEFSSDELNDEFDDDPMIDQLMETGNGLAEQGSDSTTIRSDSYRVGRNELCLCGSGKKYKKCCGRH